MIFYCVQPAKKGGESLFLDAKKLYHFLQKEDPVMLQKLLAPHSVIFGSIFGGNQFSGSVFQHGDGGRMMVRFRFDNLGYYTAPLVKHLSQLLELMQTQSATLALQQYQGYVLKNDRWLHGRTPFAGDRKAYRLLVNSNQFLPGFQESK